MTPNLEDRIIFRVEPGMRAALIDAARRQGTSASELLRAAARAAVQSAPRAPRLREAVRHG